MITGGQGSRRRRGGGRRVVRLVLALVVAGLLIALAVANGQRVTIDLLVTSREVRLIWVILVSAALGALATLVARLRSRR